MFRTVIGLDKPALLQYSQIIRYEILRFSKHIPELADAVIPIEKHHDNFKTDRMAEKFEYCTCIFEVLAFEEFFFATELLLPVASDCTVRRATSHAFFHVIRKIFSGKNDKICGNPGLMIREYTSLYKRETVLKSGFVLP